MRSLFLVKPDLNSFTFSWTFVESSVINFKSIAKQSIELYRHILLVRLSSLPRTINETDRGLWFLNQI